MAMRLPLRVFVAPLMLLGCVAGRPSAANSRPTTVAETPQEPANAPEVPTVGSAVLREPGGFIAGSPAVRTAVAVQVAEPPPVIHEFAPPAGARCPQWWTLAGDVGWPLEQMPTLDYVMGRESNCRPEVSGILVCSAGRCTRAQGLTQLLGWTCQPAGCFDPASNLAKALELWQRSGWRPWCLDGDRVTGSC